MTAETNIPNDALTAPQYIAFHVVERAAKNRWNRLGAFFAHQDGKGGTLILDSLPVGFDGRIVLRAPIVE